MFNEYNKNQFIQEIDMLLATVNGKLLPVLSENALSNDEKLEGMKPEEEINYIVSYLGMRESILNMSATWLYHLFEKAYDSISTFPQNKQCWNDRRMSLNALGVPTALGSDFYAIQNELRELNNALKHGPGSRAAINLHNINGNLCQQKNIKRFGETDKTRYEIQPVTIQQLDHYAHKMKSFWEAFYQEFQKNRCTKI